MTEKEKKLIIIKNARQPEYKKRLDETNKIIDATRSGCLDKFKISFDKSNNLYLFNGDGCTISTSALNIIISMINGKSIEVQQSIIKNYIAFMNNENYEESLLQNLIVFDNTRNLENRKKCAMMGALAIKDFLTTQQ